jgi:DNA mismatch endonuclease (patch repair protein)
MTDRISEARRSWNMSRIRGKDTKPEIAVRSMLHRLGYRFRLHRNDLPGRPDIVLPSRKTIILVHGCYWHRHPGCRYAYSPKSRVDFWEKKFSENIARDRRNMDELQSIGWRALVVWECELREPDELKKRLKDELN